MAGHILIVKVRYIISCQLQATTREMQCTVTIIKFFFSLIKYIMYITITLNRIIQSLYYSLASRCINAWMHLTRIIQSLYYAAAGRCINAWMHSLKKSVKPEIVNRYDLWVLRHKIRGAKVFVNNVQWSDQMM
jgi:hypothetical protein